MRFLRRGVSLIIERKDTVSCENVSRVFERYLTKEQWADYQAEYEKIKEEHHVFVERLKNNRHKKIAHIQYKEELGWDPDTAARINSLYALTERDLIQSVAQERVHIILSNFPYEEYLELLAKMQNLVFRKLHLVFRKFLYPKN